MEIKIKQVALRKVLRQEIKDILFQRAQSIVAERIIPQTLDDITDWTSELMGKLTTLDANEKDGIEVGCFELIYKGLIQETIEQLALMKAPLTLEKLTKKLSAK